MARAPAVQELEAPPEADRLEGFPHPRETGVLFGHADAERTLAGAVASGRMHHGWIFAGPAGIGKATLAYRLACHLLAAPAERDGAGGGRAIAAKTSAARQVKALAHPGLLVLRRQWDPKAKRLGTQIAVDEVRRLRSFLSLTAATASWRVVIVDPADELNVSAANAVLKSLEEPPPQTVFMLISAKPGRLLATIRSRCRVLALAPLGPKDLRRAADQAIAAAGRDAIDDASWPRIAHLADGSVRRALALAGNDGLVLADKVEAILALLPKVDWIAAHALADDLAAAQAGDRCEAFLALLLRALAERVRARAAGTGPLAAEARRLIPDGRLAEFAETWQAIVDEAAEADRLNLDRKALILNTLSRLAAAGGG